MRRRPTEIVVALSVCLAVRWAEAAPRDVQIRSIDIESGVIELFNFGATDIALDGWRFCTHDDNQTRRYSASAGLNGVTIEAGTSFFIHFNNDSPGGPDHVNRPAVGSFATPLNAGPYAMGLYFAPVNFGNGNTLADHLQWSIDGADNSTADERSDEAESGGVWTNQSQWIATTGETSRIVLTDQAGAALHGASDYEVTTAAVPDPRAVQIRSVDLQDGVIELFNFGATDMALDGWRFCTQDDNQTRRYSGSAGLNGVTIEAGTSFFIHFNNDSPGGPDHVNRSAVGSFATPLNAGPYAMGLYFAPVNFGNGNTLADHLQWSIDGADNSTADERSDEAESGGVWTNQSQWIATTADTVLIVLADEAGGVLHGAADYAVIARPLFGDADGDRDVDLSDLLALQPCFSGPAGGAQFVPPTPECLDVFDSDGDGDIDLADWLAVQASFTGSGEGEPTTPPAVSFANQIQPIFNVNCTVCHSSGGFADAIMHLNAEESFAALVGRSSVQNASLTRVVPRSSIASLLFLKVSSDSPPVGSRMPLGGPPLSNDLITLIRDWIDQGALNN